jgi:hypothetical protein
MIMKKIFTILITLLLLSSFTTYAQDSTKIKSKSSVQKTGRKAHLKHGKNFVDKNGDGYNDNAPDDDGDGIPNGLDPDYVKKKKRKTMKDLPFIDLDGDGINDNLQINRNNKWNLKMMKLKKLAPQQRPGAHSGGGHRGRGNGGHGGQMGGGRG